MNIHTSPGIALLGTAILAVIVLAALGRRLSANVPGRGRMFDSLRLVVSAPAFFVPAAMTATFVGIILFVVVMSLGTPRAEACTRTPDSHCNWQPGFAVTMTSAPVESTIFILFSSKSRDISVCSTL